MNTEYIQHRHSGRRGAFPALALFVLLMLVLILACTGCSVSGAAAKLKEYEQLGITEAEVTGKFSSTHYTVEIRDGQRVAEVDHSNAWLPKVRVVRKTKVEEGK